VAIAGDIESRTIAQSAGESILGFWQNTKNPSDFRAFEPERMLHANAANELLVLPVAIGESDFVIPDLGQAMKGRTINYRLQDGILHLSLAPAIRNGSMHWLRNASFRRVAKAASLQIGPLKTGAFKRPNAETINAIRKSLQERMARDQAARKNGYGRTAFEEQTQDCIWLKKVVCEYGWIDVRRFGSQSTLAAFLIAQHCLDMRLRATALAGLRKDIQNGQPVQGMYAWLYDRNTLYLHGCQRFGTHFRTASSGEIEILPLENAKKVEAWRRGIKLGTFSAEMERPRSMNSQGKLGVLKAL
jgi:hypothetical protein